MAIEFVIERNDRTYKAKADGAAAFFIGLSTHFRDRSSGEDFHGLFNVPTNGLPKLLYSAADQRPAFGFWADFIEPTSKCEGGNYLTLNTYDRAKFTFGFGQFAAHVPDGDFVVYFRDMLGRPEARDYFPDLMVKGGRIVRLSTTGEVQLENANSTKPLMNYLNPTTTHIEDDEVIAAAKFIHWTANHPAAQALQAFHMIGTFKDKMAAADRNLGLDGRAADRCAIVCDILHQGRAKYPAIRQALGTGTRDALLALGSIAYPDRIKTLKAALDKAGAVLTGKHWSASKQDFV
ncbi:hypothetical protein FHT82_005705 [Rhizobium sp. BK275]|uniref:hypothetical protein n=1 Tax=Rhizobium sp. BK275 TaxID=2587077 RepID=UPI00161FAEF2|nr:hypothetical protein [Rhizobium sp. BK275]MBB3392916.1 hypothetical protein [Rhizobium sp. BK275]